MTTEELKHYYSIYFLNEDDNWKEFKDFKFINKFFTKSEAGNAVINIENNQFKGKTLTILEIFEQ